MKHPHSAGVSASTPQILSYTSNEALNCVTINTEQTHRAAVIKERTYRACSWLDRSRSTAEEQEELGDRGTATFSAERRKDRHSEVVRGERKKHRDS